MGEQSKNGKREELSYDAVVTIASAILRGFLELVCPLELFSSVGSAGLLDLAIWLVTGGMMSSGEGLGLAQDGSLELTFQRSGRARLIMISSGPLVTWSPMARLSVSIKVKEHSRELFFLFKK